MTAEARDILKSWDGETNSDKVKAVEEFKKFAMYHSEVMSNECQKLATEKRAIIQSRNELIKSKDSEIKTKTKELSTIAGYLAISICVNFVAIGWVAWTKGWLS